MKAEMEKILMALREASTYAEDEFGYDCSKEYKEEVDQATSSLTSLIIKWLEEHKEQIIDPTPAGRINEMLDKKIRNQLITELIGEVR